MKTKTINLVVGGVILLFSSCANLKGNFCSSKIAAYSKQTEEEYLDKRFLSIKVNIGKLEPTGPKISREAGCIIITGFQLYALLYKDEITRGNFANRLLATLIRQDCLYLSEQQYKTIEEYVLPLTLAQSCGDKKSEKILKEISKHNLLPSLPTEARKLSIADKCAMHGLLNSGYIIYFDDETGYLAYKRMP